MSALQRLLSVMRLPQRAATGQKQAVVTDCFLATRFIGVVPPQP